MNGTLIRAFLRQRLTSPLRLAFLGILTVFPLLVAAGVGSMVPVAGLAGYYALVFAAGAIGQDVSSGSLQLLLARPLTRAGYLVSRWAGAALAAVALHGVVLGLATLTLLARHAPVEGTELGRLLAEGAASALGTASVIVCFSTLVNGLGDVGVFFASLLGLQIIGGLGEARTWGPVSKVCGMLIATLQPELPLQWILLHAPPPWLAIVSWASTVSLALAIGIVRLNRRELSYAIG